MYVVVVGGDVKLRGRLSREHTSTVTASRDEMASRQQAWVRAGVSKACYMPCIMARQHIVTHSHARLPYPSTLAGSHSWKQRTQP